MKRLVVCLDGTWKAADHGKEATNVVKLMRAVALRDDQGVQQLLYYDKGVGAEGGRLERAIAGATGRGLDENVKDAYLFLGNNYEPGDEIYLFGFSRGAFTARSLAGLLGTSGLLDRDKLGRFKEAWDYYRARDRKSLAPPGGANVQVACIGVWDTVGALGIPISGLHLLRRYKTRKHGFHNTSLGKDIRCAFHAVAIDEKRGPFAPTLWEWPDGKPRDQDQIVEQVWFAGCHSDVGGGYRESGLSDLALEWMIDRVDTHTDLGFRPDWRDAHRVGRHDPEKALGDPLARVHESRTIGYTFSRLFPFHRVIGQQDGWTRRKTWRVNRPKKGHTFVAEALHESVETRWQKKTPPKNRPYAPPNVEAALHKVPIARPFEVKVRPRPMVAPRPTGTTSQQERDVTTRK